MTNQAWLFSRPSLKGRVTSRAVASVLFTDTTLTALVSNRNLRGCEDEHEHQDSCRCTLFDRLAVRSESGRRSTERESLRRFQQALWSLSACRSGFGKHTYRRSFSAHTTRIISTARRRSEAKLPSRL